MIQGMGYIGTMCKVGESVSVVEDIGAMTTVTIVAHELFHRYTVLPPIQPQGCIFLTFLWRGGCIRRGLY